MGLRERFRKAFGSAAGEGPASGGHAPDAGKRPQLMAGTSLNSLTSNRVAFRNAWNMARPFWTSPERGRAMKLAGGIGALAVVNVSLAALNVSWWGGFVDAAMSKDASQVGFYLGMYAGLAFAESRTLGWYFECRQRLKMEWRKHMHGEWTEKWLDKNHKAYYHMLSGDGIDNPDHRLTEDVKWFVDDAVELLSGALNQTIQLSTFVGMLWGLSGTWNGAVMGQDFTVKGGLVWAALVMAGVGAGYTQYKGRALSPLYNTERDAEAQQRTQLIRVKQNAESIALMGGEKVERDVAEGAVHKISQTWHNIVDRQVELIRFTVMHDRFSKLVPYLALGGYFAGDISWGGVMQAAFAGEKVQTSFSWPLTVYQQFYRWKTFNHRLSELDTVINDLRNDPGKETLVVTRDPEGRTVKVRDLTINRPRNGYPLLENATLDLDPGDRLILMGESGSGKTTFLRTVAGLHRAAKGKINLPENTLFIPQKQYLPDVPLRQILCYPHPYDSSAHSDQAMAEALLNAGLPDMIPFIGEDDFRGDYFSRRLSGGEQQRLRLASILLQRPALLVIDEGTSSLDEEGGKYFYAMLGNLIREKLPDTMIWSIAHRSNLIPFHNLHGVLENRTLKIKPVPLTPEPG